MLMVVILVHLIETLIVIDQEHQIQIHIQKDFLLELIILVGMNYLLVQLMLQEHIHSQMVLPLTLFLQTMQG